MSAYKMPPRLPTDGWVRVERFGEDRLQLSVEGSEMQMVVSRYNAARIFWMLSIFLEIPLSRAAQKGIVLTPPGKPFVVEMTYPEPKTLGERVAQALIVSEMPDRIGDFEKVSEPKS